MRRRAAALRLLAGVDESGRGPLAGPVVAAAVIPGHAAIDGVADSKTLSAACRERLHTRILASARAVGVGVAEVEEIDALNIHHATLLAMRRAIENLPVAPEEVVVDGRHCPALECPARAIVGGDASHAAISAASIVAKVHRDRLMLELHETFPMYRFDRHKGYGTPQHLRALQACGVSPAHRRSYAPIRRLIAERA